MTEQTTVTAVFTYDELVSLVRTFISNQEGSLIIPENANIHIRVEEIVGDRCGCNGGEFFDDSKLFIDFNFTREVPS